MLKGMLSLLALVVGLMTGCASMTCRTVSNGKVSVRTCETAGYWTAYDLNKRSNIEQAGELGHKGVDKGRTVWLNDAQTGNSVYVSGDLGGSAGGGLYGRATPNIGINQEREAIRDLARSQQQLIYEQEAPVGAVKCPQNKRPEDRTAKESLACVNARMDGVQSLVKDVYVNGVPQADPPAVQSTNTSSVATPVITELKTKKEK